MEPGTFFNARGAAMTQVVSFPPIEGEGARVLILGTMPGIESLRIGQYYANRGNAFWKVLGTLLGFSPSESYEERVKALKNGGIALWDVLESCVRLGSLDASIDKNTAVPNDLAGLLRRHPGIDVICFNGADAEKYFRERVLRNQRISGKRYVRLPSTSSSYAAMPFNEKVAAWAGVIRGGAGSGSEPSGDHDRRPVSANVGSARGTPTRHLTLHEAIVEVIQMAGRPMTASEIATEVNRVAHYTRGDQRPVPANQISARTNNYPQLFTKRDGYISLRRR